ncbi:MAG: DUF488 family protein [Actinomycetota bacterium]|nr:DUF488 domain-containing protein [Actinomycetota bacterium]
MSREIFSIGHSTHTLEKFVELAQMHGITVLADVRTAPRSRRVPHFNSEFFGASLAQRGIAYRPMPALGGLRRPDPGSKNLGWKVPGFRAYADYMQTPAFEESLAELVAVAEERTTAYMCAEGLWWKCHRRLISDALSVRGWTVRHILSDGKMVDHVLPEFAVIEGTRLSYPPAQSSLDV